MVQHAWPKEPAGEAACIGRYAPCDGRATAVGGSCGAVWCSMRGRVVQLARGSSGKWAWQQRAAAGTVQLRTAGVATTSGDRHGAAAYRGRGGNERLPARCSCGQRARGSDVQQARSSGTHAGVGGAASSSIRAASCVGRASSSSFRATTGSRQGSIKQLPCSIEQPTQQHAANEGEARTPDGGRTLGRPCTRTEERAGLQRRTVDVNYPGKAQKWYARTQPRRRAGDTSPTGRPPTRAGRSRRSTHRFTGYVELGARRSREQNQLATTTMAVGALEGYGLRARRLVVDGYPRTVAGAGAGY